MNSPASCTARFTAIDLVSQDDLFNYGNNDSQKRKPVAEINVVPYIDVMLVLLIVFMVTAPMLEQGIDVDLPQANNEPLDIDENLEPHRIDYRRRGIFSEYRCDGGGQAIGDTGSIGDRVGRILNANPEIQVLVEGDTQADWGSMITLITHSMLLV